MTGSTLEEAGALTHSKEWLKQKADAAGQIAVWTAQTLAGLSVVFFAMQLWLGADAQSPSLLLIAVLFTVGVLVLGVCLLVVATSALVDRASLARQIVRYDQDSESEAGRNGGGSF